MCVCVCVCINKLKLFEKMNYEFLVNLKQKMLILSHWNENKRGGEV